MILQLEEFLNLPNNTLFWILDYNHDIKYKNIYHFDRNSEIKSSNNGSKSSVIETLWTNY